MGGRVYGIVVPMNGRTSKLLRKIAKLSGRSETYIKREFKNMSPALQQGYITFIKANTSRLHELRQNSPTPPKTIVLDQKIGKEA